MLTSVTGKYRNGRIELSEVPAEVPDDTTVVVTFVESEAVDLKEQGIDEAQAGELRESLAAFTDWDSPEMDIYDNYDAAKASLQTR